MFRFLRTKYVKQTFLFAFYATKLGSSFFILTVTFIPRPPLQLVFSHIYARAAFCFLQVQSVRLRQEANVRRPEQNPKKLTKVCTRVTSGEKCYDSTLSGCGRGQRAPQRRLTPRHVTTNLLCSS